MNSRPLTPLSNDPSDLNPLTPGHFLIGASLVGLPEPMDLHVSVNRLTKYKLLCNLVQQFWTRWTKEYLNSLQSRYKWQKPQQNLQPGMMVLIKDDAIIPFNWPLGRIEQVDAGDDGFVRVVNVRTQNGCYKRAANKVCPLPLDD